MSTKRPYLIALILAVASQASALGAEKPAPAAGPSAPPAEVKPDAQLDIFKNALLNDPNDQIRTKAAGAMLVGENPDGRKFLIETLKQTKNSAARIAVCKALFQAKESIKNKNDFIQPLLGVFDTQNDAEAQSAAQATLIFEYGEIGKLLENLATDTSKPVTTRLNALRALRLRPDMEATIQLIKLVDDPDKQVAAAAKNALESLGIPVGRNAAARRQDIRELKNKGNDAFLRDRLMRQETLINEKAAEVEFWRASYLTALGKIYDGLADDNAKGAFLEEQLRSPKAEVRLWALEKAYEWRVSPGPMKLPEKLGPALISLISDRDKAVRLKIAAVLPVMGEVNSAQALLTQLKVEQDDEVATELFGTLGDACYIAFLPNSTIKIPVEIRRQTLEWAAKYLADPAETKVRRAAEVMRKLLGQNGLTPAESERYLGLLANRYNGLKSDSDGVVRGSLLNAMASLCGPQSVHKAQAKKLFGPLFEAALSDKTDSVREAAADGLIYIDKNNALKMLRKFVNDPSVILRKKIIAVADEVGGKDDLGWLSEKIGTNSEGEPSWQAILKILKDLKDSDPAVWKQWADKLTSAGSKLTDDQKIAFLKTAETEGLSDFKPEARKRLAELYYTTGQFDSAADYLGSLYDGAKTPEEKQALFVKLLDACLKGSKLDRLAKLVANSLSKADLDPKSPIRQPISDYLGQPPAGADPNAVLKVLQGIKVPQGRPKWHQWLSDWEARLAKPKPASKTARAAG
jgi:HEAT repeat protein